MRNVIQIKVDTRISWAVAKGPSGRWVGVCDSFGLTMEAETLDDLNECISESIQLVLGDLLASDELDEFLQARGWRRTDGAQSGADVEFDVPMELIVQANYGTSRTSLQ